MNGVALAGVRPQALLGFQSVSARRARAGVVRLAPSLTTAAGALLLLFAALLTWCRVEWVGWSYRASALAAEARTLDAEHRTLSLELATLRSPAVLAERGAREGGLLVPGPDRVWVLGNR